MPNYGVRFYKVELFQGNKRAPLPFEVTKDGKIWRYRDHLHEVLAKFADHQVRGFPRSADASEVSAEELRKRTAMVLNSSEVRGGIVIAEFRVGRSDDFDRAYPAPDMPSTDFVPLEGYAPARPYRAVLMVPESGNVGMLAVETIGRTSPYDFLTKWATKWSKDFQADLDQSKPLADDKVRPWWRISATPLGSRDQLRKFLKSGSVEELVLVNHSIGKNRDERQERFRLKAKVRQSGKRWARKAVDEVYEIESDAVFARALAVEFGNGVEHLDIDDGWIVVKTDAGSKKISPSRLPEVFTYPVSEERPTLEQFVYAVKTQAIPLAKLIDSQIDFDSW